MKYLSPFSLFSLSYFIFSLAAIALLTQEYILGAFAQVKNNSPALSILLIATTYGLAYVIYKTTPSARFKEVKTRTSRSIFNTTNLIYTIFIISITYIFTAQYNILDTTSYLIQSGFSQAYTFKLAETGYAVANSDSKFTYAVMYFMPVFCFLLSEFYRENKSLRIFYLTLSFMCFILLAISGRREFIAFTALFYATFATHKTKQLPVKNLFIIIGAASLIIAMALIRIKGETFLDYFNTQEFYPFVYGTWILTNKDFFWAFEPYSLTPLVFFPEFLGYGNATRVEYFGYHGYGPTASIIFTTASFFPLSIALLYVSFYIPKAIFSLLNENRFSDKRRYSVIAATHSFVCTKLFILARNGEFGLFFGDIIFFFTLFTPFILISYLHHAPASSNHNN